MGEVAGLLLAAGEGSRLGRPKALVDFGCGTLAERGVALLRAGGCDPVIVVTGAADIDVAGARSVHNREWRTGMGSSLRTGLAALPSDVDAVVVALVDQPLVQSAAVRRLISAYQTGATVAVATYGGAPRNPALFAREHWAEVAKQAVGDVGARPFVRARRDLVTEVACDDVGSPADIDTPDDLSALEPQSQPPWP